MPQVITGYDFIQKLRNAGLVPDKCVRVVIEAEPTSPIRIYFEVLGDERILGVEIPAGIVVHHE